MKKFFSVALFLILITISSISYASMTKGVVVHSFDNKVIIDTSYGNYTCAEVYGFEFVDGHTLIGELEDYGFKNVYDIDIDREIEICIVEHHFNETDALEWLNGKGF